jgi:hypothetical protein
MSVHNFTRKDGREDIWRLIDGRILLEEVEGIGCVCVD